MTASSACCTLPAMGMLVAYSGTQQNLNRRASVIAAVWFLIGTTLALTILGFVAGLVGQTAQMFLGRYWSCSRRSWRFCSGWLR